jgi:Amidohydrolase
MPRLALALALVWSGTAGLSNAGQPIFDGHIHYNQDAQQRYSPEAVLRILKDAGMTRALVSSTPNDGTVKLYEAQPDFIVPFLRPYRTDADRSGWFNDPEILEFVGESLKRGIYRGIGEFHLHGSEAQSPVMQRLADLAVEKGLVLHAHSDALAIETLFRLNPRLKIIWAHAGMTAPPSLIGAMLERNHALWVELSYRLTEIAPQGELDPQWRALFLRHPERFITGSDTWNASRWEELPRLTRATRGWLSQLPQEVAAKIAYDNAARLFR